MKSSMPAISSYLKHRFITAIVSGAFISRYIFFFSLFLASSISLIDYFSYESMHKALFSLS